MRVVKRRSPWPQVATVYKEGSVKTRAYWRAGSVLRGAALALLATAVDPGATDAQPTSLPDTATQMVEVEGLATRVLVRGLDERVPGQPVIVLQAGGGSPMEAWGAWIDSASALGPVVAYDRPGIGQSAAPESDPVIESVTRHIRALLDGLGAGPPYVLVGHSWGGPLVLHFAGRYPGDVVGLVYLDPTEWRITRKQQFQTSSDAELAQREEQWGLALAALPEGLQAQMRAVDAFQRASPSDRDLPSEDPSVPTAVVLGTKLPPVTPGGPPFMDAAYAGRLMEERLDRFSRWASARDHATLIVATDAGHFVHWEAAGLTTSALRRVLQQVTALGTPNP